MKNKIFIRNSSPDYARMSLIGCFFLWNVWTVSAQYPYVKTDSIVSYYQLRDDYVNLTEGYYFQGVFNEPILSDGLMLKDSKWEKHFATPITCHPNSSALYLKLYCRNIDSIRVCVNRQIEKMVVIREKGYQYPCVLNLNEWEHLPKSERIHIKDLSITVYSSDKSSGTFVLGDIQLFGYKIVIKRPVFNPFFDEFYGIHSFDSIPEHSFSSNSWPDLYNPFYYYLLGKLRGVKGECTISQLDTVNKRDFLYNFVCQALKKYPCYELYQVDTIALFNRLRTWKDLAYAPLTDSLISLVNGIGDPHFSLRKKLHPDTKKTGGKNRNPLRFIMLNQRICVAAVLNKTIEDVKVGDQLLSYGDPAIQTGSLLRSEDVNKELNRRLRENMSLSFLRGKDTIKTVLRFMPEIESMYKIPHRKYTLNDGVFYYKLNIWDSIEYLYFHNAITENENQPVRCIIFDLRNNGGGREECAGQIASCFITRPHVYCHLSYVYDNSQMIKESWVIQPNIHLRLAHVPVILLVNKHTACASEAFCYFLKQNNTEAYIISNDEHTAGAYSSPLPVSLFDDVLLRIVCMKLYVSDGSVIERRGITPDIYVHFKNVFDLAAYNDKLLQAANELANHLKNK
jgi:hypothetical protein